MNNINNVNGLIEEIKQGITEDVLYDINISEYEVVKQVYTELNKDKSKSYVWLLLHCLFDFKEFGLKCWQEIYEEYENIFDIFSAMDTTDEVILVSDEDLIIILEEIKKIKEFKK